MQPILKHVSILLIASVMFCQVTFAQNYEKIVLDTTNDVYGYYLAVKPQGKIQGVMVLLPGFGSSAESILPETRLHNVAFVNDILTVVVNTGRKLYVDDNFTKGINAILSDVIKRYGVEKDKFILGGHSAGGTLSVRYAELCRQYPNRYPIQPQGVFSVDGPIDLIETYHYFEREIKKNFSPAGAGEATFVKDLLDKELGPLQDNLPKYAALTPFYAFQDTAGNERYLQNMAVRVYHDVDVVWMLQNRRRSVRDMNAYASSELINTLLQQGNNRAEYMPGKTGYRNDGSRHPHTWSIADEVELVQWVRKTLQFFPQYAPQPYSIQADGFTVEKSKFPLDFAPAILYKGIDDIRFLPGFYNDKSNEFWSYCFLWYLDGDITFTEQQVQRDLTTYYNGLNQQTAATVNVKKTKPAAGYEAAFDCTINTVDKFVTQKPVILHATVNIKRCTGKTIAFFEVSPQEAGSATWQQLHNVRASIGCTAGKQ